jgi:hypothetical protein
LKPFRQQQVAWHLCKNPDDLGKPKAIAEAIGCSRIEAKLAHAKLRKRLDPLDLERLCPECLSHSRLNGCCLNCGIELSDASDQISLLDTYSESYRKRPQLREGPIPVPISYETRAFLRGDSSHQLLPYCFSRMDQLLKRYPPQSELAIGFVGQAIRKNVDASLQSGSRRIGKEVKLAILGKVLVECMTMLPQYRATWNDALNLLLSFPQVILYGK